MKISLSESLASGGKTSFASIRKNAVAANESKKPVDEMYDSDEDYAEDLLRVTVEMLEEDGFEIVSQKLSGDFATITSLTQPDDDYRDDENEGITDWKIEIDAGRERVRISDAFGETGKWIGFEDEMDLGSEIGYCMDPETGTQEVSESKKPVNESKKLKNSYGSLADFNAAIIDSDIWPEAVEVSGINYSWYSNEFKIGMADASYDRTTVAYKAGDFDDDFDYSDRGALQKLKDAHGSAGYIYFTLERSGRSFFISDGQYAQDPKRFK